MIMLAIFLFLTDFVDWTFLFAIGCTCYCFSVCYYFLCEVILAYPERARVGQAHRSTPKSLAGYAQAFLVGTVLVWLIPETGSTDKIWGCLWRLWCFRLVFRHQPCGSTGNTKSSPDQSWTRCSDKGTRTSSLQWTFTKVIRLTFV